MEGELMKNVKKKTHKTSDPNWDTYTYSGASTNKFNIEWLKYYNKVEGRDQIIFLYSDRDTGKIIKYRILR